jgi:hypothetical protein
MTGDPLSRRDGLAWLDEQVASGWHRISPADVKALKSLRPQDDLRSDDPLRGPIDLLFAMGIDFETGLFMEALGPGESVSGPAFLSGDIAESLPLGPLADLPVYSELAGLRHAWNCTHIRGHTKWPYPTARSELFTLAEWVPIERAEMLRRRAHYASYIDARTFCSKCGGFCIWRLDDEQLAHYGDAASISRARVALERHGNARFNDANPEINRWALKSAVTDLSEAETELIAVSVGDLRPIADALLEVLQPQLRRVHMRTSTV